MPSLLPLIRDRLASALVQLRDTCVHPDDPAFLRDLEAAQRGEGLALPQMPEDLARVRLVLSDPDAGPRDLANAVRHNPVIAARLLTAARAAFFGASRPTEVLDDAIVRMGMKHSVALVLALVSRSALFSSLGYQHDAKRVFRHALATAVTSQLLAELSAPDLAVDAFLAGLLHDFGRVYVLAIAGGDGGPDSTDRGAPSRAFLDSASDATHAAFGAMLAHTWNCEPVVVRAVLDHHLDHPIDEASEPAAAVLRQLVHAADVLAHRLDEPLEAEDVDAPTLELLESYDVMEEILREARESVDAFEGALEA